VRYRVDEALCCGHGQCRAVAPELFTADADGFVTPVGVAVDVPPGRDREARDGAAACPEQAIQIDSLESSP
jgi:ferredoxin